MGGCAPNNCNRPSNIDWDPTDEIGSQRSKQTTSTRKAKPMKAGEKSVNEDEEGNQDAQGEAQENFKKAKQIYTLMNDPLNVSNYKKTLEEQ